MTQPTVDIDQLRRQFPQQVVQYFDAVVQSMEWRLTVIENTLTRLEDEVIPQVANAAAQAAEQAFEQQALSAIVAELAPEIDEYISEGIVDIRTGNRFQFYIDTQEHIDELADRDDNVIYVWKDS